MALKTTLKAKCPHCGSQQVTRESVWVYFSPCYCRPVPGPQNPPRHYHHDNVRVVDAEGEVATDVPQRSVKPFRSIEKENDELRQLLREIIDDASPCTMACNLMVEERLIERAKELLGL